MLYWFWLFYFDNRLRFCENIMGSRESIHNDVTGKGSVFTFSAEITQPGIWNDAWCGQTACVMRMDAVHATGSMSSLRTTRDVRVPG